MLAVRAPSLATDETAPPPVPWPRVEQFVSQFIHDIRNGLNAIELQLTLLGEISADPEVVTEVKAVRGTLLEVARQLEAVKVATGPISPHLLTYPAADFFEDLRERFARHQPDNAADVTWNIAVADASLAVDPELCLSALLELFTNASRFGGARPIILFSAETGPNGATIIVVRETGAQAPLVPPADWGLTPLLTTRRGAYGLGLFRVRRIIEAQGGTFQAEYTPIQEVLTTTISLPGAGGRAAD